MEKAQVTVNTGVAFVPAKGLEETGQREDEKVVKATRS